MARLNVGQLIDLLKRFPAGAEVRVMNEKAYYASEPIAFQRVNVERPFTPPEERGPEDETVYLAGPLEMS